MPISADFTFDHFLGKGFLGARATSPPAESYSGSLYQGLTDGEAEYNHFSFPYLQALSL